MLLPATEPRTAAWATSVAAAFAGRKRATAAFALLAAFATPGAPGGAAVTAGRGEAPATDATVSLRPLNMTAPLSAVAGRDKRGLLGSLLLLVESGWLPTVACGLTPGNAAIPPVTLGARLPLAPGEACCAAVGGPAAKNASSPLVSVGALLLPPPAADWCAAAGGPAAKKALLPPVAWSTLLPLMPGPADCAGAGARAGSAARAVGGAKS